MVDALVSSSTTLARATLQMAGIPIPPLALQNPTTTPPTTNPAGSNALLPLPTTYSMMPLLHNPAWSEHVTEGRTYYYNSLTGESVWTRPADYNPEVLLNRTDIKGGDQIQPE
eukprot:c8087_g1_i4.p1 GENE.c8087_g1_i4~~c8087_g1_i4.p1  ORF type:complete len:113 (+),score=12.61 c8087_g1_i4:212-550(+)